MNCQFCGKSNSLSRFRQEVTILQSFYFFQPVYRLSRDLEVDIKVVIRVYQHLREGLYHLAELEGVKLKGVIELDEAYVGGRRKGKLGRAASGNCVVFWVFCGGDRRVYTKVVESGRAEELMRHIQAKPGKVRSITPMLWGLSVLETLWQISSDQSS